MHFILIITVTLMSIQNIKKSNTYYNDPPLNSINKDKIILSYYSWMKYILFITVTKYSNILLS